MTPPPPTCQCHELVERLRAELAVQREAIRLSDALMRIALEMLRESGDE